MYQVIEVPSIAFRSPSFPTGRYSECTGGAPDSWVREGKTGTILYMGFLRSNTDVVWGRKRALLTSARGGKRSPRYYAEKSDYILLRTKMRWRVSW